MWLLGKVIENQNPDEYRKDKCGRIMQFSKYGDRNSVNGWEIDHIDPVANGGTDVTSNLQPLNWKMNADKSDKLNWTCPLL